MKNYLLFNFLFFMYMFTYINTEECCSYSRTIYYVYKPPATSCDEAVEGGFPYKNIICSKNNCCAVNKICPDGNKYDKTYCSYGDCNMFGCSCKKGCINDYGRSLEENFRDTWQNAKFVSYSYEQIM